MMIVVVEGGGGGSHDGRDDWRGSVRLVWVVLEMRMIMVLERAIVFFCF